ncbi:sialate O-acetylesterase [Bifidobacterium pseudocatenulatum]|nr:sialate O-acetylesterase [Bifidobacterium pseudocatenulatum]MZN96935.1 sialate O-acetylesterase [Bifidobacterium pseudocatenulatum]MZO00523.1 sialate O-acetylesterase [Bifidobacterium pseudocatenulatum]MZO05910.1 sialate O-acetylesterase [Bifidobacterium pseudocatenulatum]MZO07646.1 sialate O-acetylesterase [Bifidobacterium pseudocatenulatum]
MKKKRLARVIIAAVVTAAILVAIIVGCGPKWGDGSANVNGSNSNSSSSASDNVSSNDNATQSNNNYATRITVKLPSYYLENMVFQRGKTLVVKGTATTSQRGKVVDPTQLITTISQGKKSTSAQAKISKNGDFTCTLPKQKASLKPYSLTILYNETTLLTLKNVYVGDVFIAAGQSNMELNYSQYYEGSGNSYNFGGGLITTDDLPKQLSDNNVHFVASANSSKGTDFPLRDMNEQAGTWLEATVDNSQHFSYLAQQFAMQLRAAHPNVPIGIIQTAWGGTPIRRHVQGGDIYANHIAPLEGFHVAGVLWYQGCNDSTNEATALAYESQMTLLINQYREVFDQDDLPFLYVQLARWPGYQYTQNVRFAQLNTLSNAGLRNASNVAMTVSLDTDKGTSTLIHPLGKDILGARMAAQYLAMSEGRTIPNGPLIAQAKHASDGTIVLSFQNGTATGLQAEKPNYSRTASATVPDYDANPDATPLNGISNVATPTSTPLQGFEIADDSGKWVSATATIKGDQIVLSAADGSSNCNAVTQVRYWWSGNPVISSLLYNDLGLPASPFIAVVE